GRRRESSSPTRTSRSRSDDPIRPQEFRKGVKRKAVEPATPERGKPASSRAQPEEVPHAVPFRDEQEMGEQGVAPSAEHRTDDVFAVPHPQPEALHHAVAPLNGTNATAQTSSGHGFTDQTECTVSWPPVQGPRARRSTRHRLLHCAAVPAAARGDSLLDVKRWCRTCMPPPNSANLGNRILTRWRRMYERGHADRTMEPAQGKSAREMGRAHGR